MDTHYDKIACITGAGAGIGRAIAARLARDGYTLAIADLDEQAARSALDAVGQAESGGAWRIDVRDAESVDRVIGEVERRFGRIDLLCNNAGVSTMGRFYELTEQEWDDNVDVNMKAVWLVTRRVVPQMIARRAGRIVVTASMAAKIGAAYLAHYSASKFGVLGLVQAMARELAEFGITCNAVCPGFVRTGMQDREVVWEAALRDIDDPEQVRREYVRMTPLGRLCRPEDVAGVVAFLASDDAAFMTGQGLNVTGGVCMH